MGAAPIFKIQRDAIMTSFRTRNFLAQVDFLSGNMLEQSRVNMAAVEAGSMVSRVWNVCVGVYRHYLVGFPVTI